MKAVHPEFLKDEFCCLRIATGRSQAKEIALEMRWRALEKTFDQRARTKFNGKLSHSGADFSDRGRGSKRLTSKRFMVKNKSQAPDVGFIPLEHCSDEMALFRG